jgi:hypothetical protein
MTGDPTGTPDPDVPKPTGRDAVRDSGKLRALQLREDRLKAALKDNMARRKAQARTRQTPDQTGKNNG